MHEQAKNKKILIRCDGAPEIGLGHVVRCLALADELKNAHECEVEFAMLRGPLGKTQVEEQGYVVHQPINGLIEGRDEDDWLKGLVARQEAQVLLLDVRTNLSIETIREIRAAGVVIATIDDPSDRRLAADLAFYPPVPQAEWLDWSGFSGKRFVGWEWVLIRKQFAKAREQLTDGVAGKKQSQPPVIMVTMGGSDPTGLTLMTLKALDQIDQHLRVKVVLGRG